MVVPTRLEISSWKVLPSLQPQWWMTTWGVPAWFNKLTDSSCSGKAKGLCSLIILVCLAIWREQNARIFKAQEKCLPQLLAEIRDEVKLWVKAGAKHLSLLAGSRFSE
jgi:hypothetical protein